jgi:hypothetical protein
MEEQLDKISDGQPAGWKACAAIMNFLINISSKGRRPILLKRMVSRLRKNARSAAGIWSLKKGGMAGLKPARVILTAIIKNRVKKETKTIEAQMPSVRFAPGLPPGPVWDIYCLF